MLLLLPLFFLFMTFIVFSVFFKAEVVFSGGVGKCPATLE